jgi:hypothetical protein
MIHDYFLYDKESERKPYRGRTFFKQAGVVKLTLNEEKNNVIFLDEKNNRKLTFTLDEIKEKSWCYPYVENSIGIYYFVENTLGLKRPEKYQRMKLICNDVLNN